MFRHFHISIVSTYVYSVSLLKLWSQLAKVSQVHYEEIVNGTIKVNGTIIIVFLQLWPSVLTVLCLCVHSFPVQWVITCNISPPSDAQTGPTLGWCYVGKSTGHRKNRTTTNTPEERFPGCFPGHQINTSSFYCWCLFNLYQPFFRGTRLSFVLIFSYTLLHIYTCQHVHTWLTVHDSQ